MAGTPEPGLRDEYCFQTGPFYAWQRQALLNQAGALAYPRGDQAPRDYEVVVAKVSKEYLALSKTLRER